MLRRTTTPSAGLETCTGDRLSTVGWTTTTGLGIIFGGTGAGAAATGSSCPTEAGSKTIGSVAIGAIGSTGATGAGTTCTGAATSRTTGAEGLANIAGSPRAMKKAEMRASCS